jgi:outer membrane autotransporter protein
VNINGTIGSFTNSGLIESKSTYALRLNSQTAPDLIVNTGGTLLSPGGSAVHIGIDLGVAGVTIEGGTLQGNLAMIVLAPQTGAITVKNAALEGGIEFSFSEETLNISGSSLNGDIVFTDTDNNLNFEQGGTTTIAAGTEFINTTFFSLLGGANVVSNSEQSAANSDILKLTVVANADLVLNQNFWVDDAVFSQGLIEIAAGKTLSANEFSGDGAYVFDVTDESTVAKIEAHGAFSKVDLTGATIEVKLTNPSTMFASGTNLLLGEDLNGNDVLGVASGAAAADNSALLNFLLYRGDAPEIGLTSDLLFAQVQLALLADIAGEGDDPNSIALGAALDAIGLDGDADIDDLMLALALLPTNEDINEVLDSLLPETDGIAYDIATDMGGQALDVASKRLDTLLAARLANEYRLASLAPIALRGSMNEGASRFWAQAFGRAVDQDRHSYNTGYDATSYGFAFGADTNLDKATALGAAFSYTSTDANGNGLNQTDTDVDSYQLTLYGDHLFDNATYAKGLLAYGWHANDIARHDVGGIPGNTATGSYDADHITARAELGRAYKGGDTLTLIPRVHVNAAWYSPDGYSEQGVGGLGLTVAPDDLTSVRLGVGVLARWDITLSGEELFQPELRLDYRRDLTRERFETTSVFLGAPGITFRTQGVEPAADILNLGVGALLATAGGVDLRASYDVELKEDYTAHAGYLRASIPF